jgi:hypothetical protein
VELELPFFDDPDNTDPARRRSRLRTDVIPYLAGAVNPGVTEALLRAGAFTAADDAVLEARAAAVPVRVDEGEARIPAAALAALPEAVASRAVRTALRAVAGPYPGTARDVATVLAAVREQGPRPLSGDLLAAREGPWVVIYPAHPETHGAAPTPLPVPGRAAFGRWVLEARFESERPAPRPIGRLIVLLPPAEALEVRCARPGETLAVRGGAKRVVDVLREGGVPARLRLQWPVLTADGRMVWVVGVRAAESTLPEAGPVLLVTARRESP